MSATLGRLTACLHSAATLIYPMHWSVFLFTFYIIHTYIRLKALCPGLPGWAGTRKVKPIWILLKQETVSGSGVSWAICKSALRSRQIIMPAPHHSVFYRPDAVPATQPTASKHWRHFCLLFLSDKSSEFVHVDMQPATQANLAFYFLWDWKEFRPKCDYAVWLWCKGRYGLFDLGINFWVVGYTLWFLVNACHTCAPYV